MSRKLRSNSGWRSKNRLMKFGIAVTVKELYSLGMTGRI